MVEYYGLIWHIAKKIYNQHFVKEYYGTKIEFLDLVQEGWCGLLDAKSRFDSSKGTRLTTFATPRITGQILDYLREWRDPHTPKEIREIKRLEDTERVLTSLLGRPPTRSEIAEAMKMEEEEVEQIEVLRMREKVSIEDLTIQNERGKEVPWEPGNELTPGNELEKKLLPESVNDCFNALNERQRSVLIHRFLDGFTLEAVGKLLGSSKDTVRRRQEEALANMKRCLELKGWSIEDF